MKKYGKKWRKIQKEKAIRKANTKVGEPFSKARHKKRLCLHYAGIPGGFTRGHCYSKLVRISDAGLKGYSIGGAQVSLSIGVMPRQRMLWT